MTALANWFMLAHGWRRALGLIAAGALGALAMPPLFALPGLFIAVPVWIWSLDGAEVKTGWRRFFGDGFAIGFWIGLGYFVVALHWLGAAFFVDGGWMLALMPPAVAGLAAVLALFWAAASAISHLFWRPGSSRIFVLAGFVALAEFARGHLFSGFPFDLLGYALTANEQMMQAASLVGVYGLTLLVLVIAATPALVWPGEKRALTVRLLPFFLGLGVLGAQLGYGQYRLTHTVLTERTDVRLRLVQPNIDQAVKWQANSASFVLDRLISLSNAKTTANDAGLLGVNAVIWPESAFPFYLSQHPEALAKIARMLPKSTLLISGAPYLDPADPRQKTAYNAILAIDHAGEIVSSYAKTHLVPFGEYLPYGDFFAKFGLRQFVNGDDGWTAGDMRRPMTPPGMPGFLPLICYEAVFSGDLDPLGARPAFLLNLTNDAWFDGTIGPEQHFHHARVRAVEEGMSLVRVANTGVSGLVDPLGRVVASLPVQKVGVLDVVPDKALAPTPFVRWRHWPFVIALALMALGGLVTGRRRSGY